MAKFAYLPLLLLCLISASPEAKSSDDEELISEVKHVAVSKLDHALPSIPFERWLRTEAGADAQYQWEVNDCGEQTGALGQNAGEIPTCVEVDATLSAKREIIIMISVQEGDNPKASKTQPAYAVFFAQLVTPHETINIKQLSDFPAALVRTHKPTSNPEIAK